MRRSAAAHSAPPGAPVRGLKDSPDGSAQRATDALCSSWGMVMLLLLARCGDPVTVCETGELGTIQEIQRSGDLVWYRIARVRRPPSFFHRVATDESGEQAGQPYGAWYVSRALRPCWGRPFPDEQGRPSRFAATPAATGGDRSAHRPRLLHQEPPLTVYPDGEVGRFKKWEERPRRSPASLSHPPLRF
jgi:hypothetical protein